MNYELTPVNRGYIVRPAGNPAGYENTRFFRSMGAAHRWIAQQARREQT